MSMNWSKAAMRDRMHRQGWVQADKPKKRKKHKKHKKRTPPRLPAMQFSVDTSEVVFSRRPGGPWSVLYRGETVAEGLSGMAECWACVAALTPPEDEPSLSALMGERIGDK